MATGAGLVIIATFMQCFGPRGNVGVFIGGRVLVGMGQGVACTAGPAYINEMAPAEVRGKIMSFWQMFYSVGSFIAYWVRISLQDICDFILTAHSRSVMPARSIRQSWVTGTGRPSSFSNFLSPSSSSPPSSHSQKLLDGISNTGTV